MTAAQRGAVRLEALLACADDDDLVITAAHTRTRGYGGLPALTEAQIQLVRGLEARSTPQIFVLLGSPYVLATLPEVSCLVLAYDFAPLVVGEVPGLLVGERPFTGRLPVALPGVLRRLDSPRRKASRLTILSSSSMG